MRAGGLDPRVARGMRAQLELRRARLAAGERPLGWKVGFGAPASMEKLGTDRPLVGFLTDRSLVADGASVPVGDWTAPVFEAEIAVHLARDVAAGATRDQVREAIGGLSAAIELADLDAPPVDPEAILAGNIFHRHVVLGPVHDGVEPDAVTGRVLRDGTQIASNDAPAALTGDVVDVVRVAAGTLAACGEGVRAGDVIIMGSVVPPVPIAPGQTLTAELPPLGSLAIELL